MHSYNFVRSVCCRRYFRNGKSRCICSYDCSQGLQSSSSSLKRAFLASIFSVAASIIRSASLIISISVEPLILPIISALSASVIFSFLIHSVKVLFYCCEPLSYGTLSPCSQYNVKALLCTYLNYAGSHCSCSEYANCFHINSSLINL